MNDYCEKCSFWSGGENLKVKQDPDNLQKISVAQFLPFSLPETLVRSEN